VSPPLFLLETGPKARGCREATMDISQLRSGWNHTQTKSFVPQGTMEDDQSRAPPAPVKRRQTNAASFDVPRWMFDVF
jgi:hypothetical protein